MNFKTIADLNRTIQNNIHKIPNEVDLIVGIPRSGLLVGTLVALYLNLPLTDIDSFLEEKILGTGSTKVNKNWIKNIEEAKKILIVEDSSISGKSLIEAREKIKQSKFADRVVFLTIYVTNETKLLTDIFFEICNPPRVFEWNYMYNNILNNACVDIDGVLCADPSEEENDDGEKYIEFIKNAELRCRPSKRIAYLITSRLEKYREDTEFWLNKNGILYDNLIMMNLQTKEERIKSGSHGKFKGEHYKNIKTSKLFIESNKNQAKEIAVISGKPVFCVDNQEVYEGNETYKIYEEQKYKFKQKLLRIIPKPIKNIIKKIIKK